MTRSAAAALVEPAYANFPPYTETLGPLVADICAEAGFPPDPEQEMALDAMFALHPKDPYKSAAFEFAIVCPRQNMKALDVSTPLLTERGWSTMGAAAVGDRVFHPAGHLVTVTHVSDVKLGQSCYRVTTTDGRSVIADAGHLWTVFDRRFGRRGQWRTTTTAEMLAGGLERSAHGQRTVTTAGVTYATSECRFQLPIQEPLKSADVDLPIDPYLFGAWLGDGKSNGASLSSHADDVAHWRGEIERCGFVSAVRIDRTCSTVAINATPGPGSRSRTFVGALRNLGVLNDKHVPDEYLSAGTIQREALLQGLMDTDGTINRRSGQASFTTTSRRLGDAVVLLVRSLGWRASVKEGRALLNGRDCGPKFYVAFTPKAGDPFAPFRMQRKAERVQSVDGGKGRFTISIKSIELVPSVPVCCIKVDSPDGLFLAGRDLIATHNTGLMKMAALGWLFVTDQRLVVWSAHEMKTTKEAFLDLTYLIENTPALSRRLAPGPSNGIMRGNGDEAIELAPTADCPRGQRIMFKARTGAGGKGLTGDRVILDEAFALKPSHIGSLLPTLSARPDPQVVYGSSAGYADSEVLRGIRDRGRPGGDPSLAYMEFCAPEDTCEREDCQHFLGTPGCALDNMDYVRMANPATGRRITEDYLRAERRALPPAEYARERLGWWDKPDMADLPLISEQMWTDCKDPESNPLDPVSFGVYVNRMQTNAAIGVAAYRADGRVHVAIVPAKKVASGEPVLDTLPGVGWIPGRVKELVEQWSPCATVIDNFSVAGALIAEIEELGVTVEATNGTDLAKACQNFYSFTLEDKLRHQGAQPLERSVLSGKKRDLLDGWAWDRKDKGDITQLMAVTLAVHGLVTHKQPEAPPQVHEWPDEEVIAQWEMDGA